ncbi:MAG: hypothetical protein P8182_07270 [Deltaproteobacteria bacterium]
MAAGLVEMIRGKRESEQICSMVGALSLMLYAGYLIESIEASGTTGVKC